MPRIQQLSTSVVNKIAAGEVIERPASVVKELVENSLDAGATRVDVTVEQGGSDLIRVVDNGCGIAAEQLHLAVASHATSKLADAEDLFRVRTLGFRGEALASIAEISRFTLRSRTAEEEGGAELEVVAGERAPLVPCSSPRGTTIEVRNLFFNTPVRRKFMRSVQTEMGHVTEAFTRLALAFPQVHFCLRHNQRTIHDLHATEDPRERIARFFGEDLARDLIWVESRDDDVRLSGYVALPSQSRSNNRMQYLFLNGRHIRDRALQHALAEAYRGLLLTGRHAMSFLSFEMPPDLVDVNVHPTKLEVRFQDGGRLYSQLLGTLRSKFLTTDLTHRFSPVAEQGGGSAHDPQRAAELRSELVDWAKGQLAAVAPATTGRPALGELPDFADNTAEQGNLSLAFERPRTRPLELTRLDGPWQRAADIPAETRALERSTDSAGSAPADGYPVVTANGGEASTTEWHQPAPHYRAQGALQVHDRYLVAESAEGVLVIDQHALHERILYEQLRAKILAGELESQHLLVPEPVDLSSEDAALVLEQSELLARLGVKVAGFGGSTVLVSSYPAMLRNVSPGELLREIVDGFSAGQAPDRRDLLDELLHMISCKAAIKAGDRLTQEEIQALLESRHLAQDTHHCPHGRPTALVFTREELDRQFLRT